MSCRDTAAAASTVDIPTGWDPRTKQQPTGRLLALPAAGPCCSNPSRSQSQRVAYVYAKEKQQRNNYAAAKSGPRGIRTLDLSDANRTLSQLSYGPISPLFAGFCNKKLIFKFSDFRRIQRKTSPKSWTETRRSMCDHRDANRTLSQLSYAPIHSSIIITQIFVL